MPQLLNIAKEMDTILVTVEQTEHAFMLAEWLKSIRFVQKVTIKHDYPSTGNAESIQHVFDSIKSKRLFSDISDPVAYQKQLRDEWR